MSRLGTMHAGECGFRRARLRLWSMAAVGVVIGGVAFLSSAWPGPAVASTPIMQYSAMPSSTQAGGHPDVEISFEVENRQLQRSNNPCNCEDAKDATVHLPPGFIGDPHATPECTLADFSANECPVDSQVGIVSVFTIVPLDAALYNLAPPPADAGLLGFKIPGYDAPQFTVLSARTESDYGLDAKVTSIYHGAYPLQGFQEDLWGVPADPRHDQLRLNPREMPGGEPGLLGALCNAEGAFSTSDPNSIVELCETDFISFTPVASNSPLRPFLQNPTSCAVSLGTSLQVLSYDGETTEAHDAWPKTTGCDQLSFNPSLFAQPSTKETDSASGMDINLTVPQQMSPSLPSPSELRGATVSLPPGLAINPNAADGKVVCTDAEAHLGIFASREEAHCPEYSKIGSLSIESSALPGKLPGFVYLGQPLPGERYRIFLVANGFGEHIKLAGTIDPSPRTGQLTVSFRELPQTPLTAFNMHIFGSERGLLATPTNCGRFTVESTFTPWDSNLGSQSSPQYFSLDSGPGQSPCPGASRPFAPTLAAGSVGNTAGAHTQFGFELNRADGEQNLAGLTITTPPGFAATLAGVQYCPNAALAHASEAGYSGIAEREAPSCPAASQVGTSITGVGAGSHQLHVPGKVYLAGPYKGAPLSLAVVTPAISGPYDLGNVVVRAAIHVDPADVHITAVSDPLPQIFEGIPLRMRSILVKLDRPNFALNPTNCSSFTVRASLGGDQGGVAKSTTPFQVANCDSLPFEPKLKLSFSGGIKRIQDPALTAVLSAKPGEAGIARVAVTLPPSELLDNAHIHQPCTPVEFGRNACPRNAVIGFAKADTPLLEAPLEGPVYLMSSSHRLPDIVAALHGQFDVTLDGRVTSVPGRLRTIFSGVPDAPVSRFTLKLFGGKRGLIQNTVPLCKANLDAVVTLTGQNELRDNQNQAITPTPCHRAGRRKAQSHRSRGR